MRPADRMSPLERAGEYAVVVAVCAGLLLLPFLARFA